MAVGDIITATRYNALQTRVESILGTGSGTEGYGQSTASGQVVIGNTVTASHVNQLQTDIDRISRHQTNQAVGGIASIVIGDQIADETSDDPDGTLKGFADYETSMINLESSPNRFRLSALQSTSGSDPDTLTFGPTAWRNNLNGYFRVVFTSANARRNYFNAGGTITFVSGLVSTATGGNVAKTNDWFEEYLSPIIAIKIVNNLDDAIKHIGKYGSLHTDAIVASDKDVIDKFKRLVNSSSVMINTSTRFADGYEYGLGAEIGISTDKLHVRGPVGLEGLTNLKYIISSQGKLRN